MNSKGAPPPYVHGCPPPTHHSTPQASGYAQSPPATVVVTERGVPGACPVCGNASWTGTYSCCAWLLCFFCFWNCGLCCCLCMRQKKCTKCGFTCG